MGVKKVHTQPRRGRSQMDLPLRVILYKFCKRVGCSVGLSHGVLHGFYILADIPGSILAMFFKQLDDRGTYNGAVG